ncbi:unnamed protein product, partial [Mesorhabditis spiculigera]
MSQATIPYGIPGINDLRSVHTLDRVNIRFYNCSQTNVDLIWIDFEGRPILYTTIGAKSFFDITTSANMLGSRFLKKVREIAGTKDIEGTVHRALTAPDADATELFATFRSTVDRDEIIDVIVQQSIAHSAICKKLTSGHLEFLVEHYRLLAVGSASTLLKKLAEKATTTSDGLRNIIFLINHAIQHMNVIGSEKLCHFILDYLPSTINSLRSTAKGLIYPLLQTYFDVYIFLHKDLASSRNDFGSGLVDFEGDPFFTLLIECLSTKAASKHPALPDVPSNDVDWDMNAQATMSRYILRHATSIRYQQNFAEKLVFAIKTFLAFDKVDELEESIAESNLILRSDVESFWDPLSTALVSVLGTSFENEGTDSEPVKKKRKKGIAAVSVDHSSLKRLFTCVDAREMTADKFAAMISLVIRGTKSPDNSLSIVSWDILYSLIVEQSTDVAVKLTTLPNEEITTALLDAPSFPEGAELFKIYSLIWRIFACNQKLLKKLRKAEPSAETRDLFTVAKLRLASSGAFSISQLGTCLLDALVSWNRDNVNEAIELNVIDSKRRKKLADFAFNSITDHAATSSQKSIALEFFKLRAATFLKESSKIEKAHIERLLDWEILAAIEPHLVATIVEKAQPPDLVKLIDSYPITSNNSKLLLALDAVLCPKLQKFVDPIVEKLRTILSNSCEMEESIQLSATILQNLCAPKNAINDLVGLMTSLVLNLLTLPGQKLSENSYALVHCGKLLSSLLRAAPHKILHDRCATYIGLFGLYLQKVTSFVEKNPGDGQIPQLRDSCERIVGGISTYEEFFEMTIPGTLASTVLGWEHLPLTFIRLTSIMRPKLSACLATNLPPSEKRAFSRLMENVKRANKKTS